ncbi:MAG TPA: sigma-54 dependent transcriptional regulator [Thermoanaerobaculia bacterium]|nr:sigma-54 dependent transcriptional regulator [Thermoanaerobaculia bacterium]
MTPKLMIVDDEPAFRLPMSRYLTRNGFSVCDAGTLRAARATLAAEHCHGMLLDLHLPDGNGLDWIEEVRQTHPDLALVVITGSGDIPLAVEAMRRGADHFVAKPIEPAEVAAFLRRTLEMGARRPRETRRSSADAIPFFGSSTAAHEMRQLAEVAASSDSVVLITGETGSGKGVLARWIHEQSARRAKRLVEVNCSSLRGELLANEMFGHARGAFTSAGDAQSGLLDAADGGTLFLDEIGDMDLSIQAQLLKTIEEKRYRRLGDVTNRRSDFRLLCATNHSLRDAVAAGRFRSDLFYRINVLPIRVPPLREHIGDIRGLVQHLAAVPIEPAALALLEHHRWPGNIRELRNVLERAALLARGEPIAPRHLDLDSHPTSSRATAIDVLAVLHRNGDDKECTARELGISRATLYRRLKDLQRPSAAAVSSSSQ